MKIPEPNRTPRLRSPVATLMCLLAALFLFSGCHGIPTREETAERQRAKSVTAAYRPDGARPILPSLSPGASWSDYIQFAVLNSPKVEAAYYEWIAAVERITVERSLPDPRLTFQMDIASTVESLMPGLMVDLPGPGKLAAKAAVASAESAAKFATFQSAVLESVYGFKRAFHQTRLLQERIRVSRATLRLLEDLESAALKQNEVGKATLQDVLRAQIEHDRLTTEIANLEQFKQPLSAQLKASLGLAANSPDIPLPVDLDPVSTNPPPETLLAQAFARNPRLKAMEAEIRQSEAAIALARKSRIPDTSVGLEADPLASPVMFRPQAGITLPIWKDKLAAELAAAKASSSAAKARLAAERIQIGMDLAEKSYMYREAVRNLELAQSTLLPKARLSLEVARAAYMAGKIDFLNVMDAWRTVLSMELEAISARTQHELTLAEISLLIAGVLPNGSPDWMTPAATPTPAPSPSQASDSQHAH